MTKDEAIILSRKIQQAFESRDLEEILRYYHQDIVYIGPAYHLPLEGIDRLKAAFIENFRTPQRVQVTFEDIKVRELSNKIFAVYGRFRGIQSALYRESRFEGMLTRVFIENETSRLVIHEHLSLSV